MTRVPTEQRAVCCCLSYHLSDMREREEGEGETHGQTDRVKERERERERQTDRQTDREGGRGGKG